MACMSPEIRNAIQDFLEKAEKGSLVQSVNRLHDFLLEKKLAWKQKIHPSLIGCSESNRDGQGVSAAHVQELISSIGAIGFSSSEVKAVALEIPLDSRGDACRSFNRRLVDEASGKLAPVEHLRYASIVGSHSNQAARAFLAGVAHKDAHLCVDGRLSLEKLRSHDSAWAHAIQEGVDWLIVSWDVAECFPTYAGLAQAAGNAAGQIAAVEHELQLAKKLNLAIHAHIKRSGQTIVSYCDVSQEILRSRPPNASSLPGVFQFVLRCGGGVAQDAYMQQSEKHIVSHGNPTRPLGVDIWTSLASEIKGKEQHVAFRHMLLKLAFCGPERILTVSDVKRAMTSKELLNKATQAEMLLKQMAGLLQQVFSNKVELAKQVAELEIQFAAVVLQKRKVTKAESLEEVCNQTLSLFGLPSPFQVQKPSEPAATTSASSTSAQGSCLG